MQYAVDKEQFLFLAQHYTSLTAEETAELEQLQQAYPYCQAAHILATRGAQQHHAEVFQKQLHLSAVYATDRSVLKSILNAPSTSRANGPAEVAVLADAPTDTGADWQGVDVAKMVMDDLQTLQELKHHFEASVREYDEHNPPRKVVVTNKAIKEAAPRPAPAPAKQEPAAIRKAEDTFPAEDQPEGDAILDQLRSKKKLKTESDRQKEQLEIIDQFIKKQPSIPKATQPVAEAPDLSEKNSSLTDNIVSETLVEILLRQGKKDKAIEVLKKLIWKFPQKKAIFAAQIEELKK